MILLDVGSTTLVDIITGFLSVECQATQIVLVNIAGML